MFDVSSLDLRPQVLPHSSRRTSAPSTEGKGAPHPEPAMTKKNNPDTSLDVLRDVHHWEPAGSIETTASTTETALWHLIENTVTPREADKILGYFDSTSYAVGAELLDISESTLRVTMHQVRKKLEGRLPRSADGRVNVPGSSGTSK